MTFFDNGDAHLHYDVEGEGFPVLVLAPGGMRSANDMWNGAPWNPRTALTDAYRVIGMDQRNAGASTAPVSAEHGWKQYCADQLALLDHLAIDTCHVIGMCIGGPFIAALLSTAPERFRCAVMLQPAGFSDNHAAYTEMYDQWVLARSDDHPEAQPADWAGLGEHMWGGDFVFSATREQAAAWPNPLLVMMGNDLFHPQAVSREIADLAPHATLVEQWKDTDSLPACDATIRAFLAGNTPT